MEAKINNWTVNLMDKGGFIHTKYFDFKHHVKEFLKTLEEDGQDMDDVHVFAPRTNLTIDEFNNYFDKDSSKILVSELTHNYLNEVAKALGDDEAMVTAEIVRDLKDTVFINYIHKVADVDTEGL